MGILGSLINTVGGGIIGGINQRRQQRYNKQMMEWQYNTSEKQAENAYKRGIDFWNKQNEYNSPAQQRKRMKDANINPAVAYSNGQPVNTAGGFSSMPQGQAQGVSAQLPTLPTPDIAQSMNAIAQAKAADATAEKTKAETDGVKATTDLTKEKTETENTVQEINKSTKTLVDAKIIREETGGLWDKLNLRVGLATEGIQIATAGQELQNMKQDFKKMGQELQNMTQMFQNLKEQLKFTIKQGHKTDAETKQIVNNYALQGQQLINLQVEASLKRAGVKYTKAQINEVVQRIGSHYMFERPMMELQLKKAQFDNEYLLMDKIFDKVEQGTRAYNNFMTGNAKMIEASGEALEGAGAVIDGIVPL